MLYRWQVMEKTAQIVAGIALPNRGLRPKVEEQLALSHGAPLLERVSFCRRPDLHDFYASAHLEICIP